MNSLITDYYPTFRMYQALRGQLLELLSDEDLRFTPGGQNPSLGALCVEIGEVQQAYNRSFMDGRIDFSYRNPEPGLAASVSQLATWYRVLDAELEAVISHLSEEDIKTRQIDRGGWSTTPLIQLEVYKEALLIFYGKVSVYLKAMSKPRPQQWREWIA
ncbi:MAG TPA: DinB family protein [Anaerolineae bacterium]|nr:DinB family protein [Anaerolineae bacterium]